ncbi:MAG: GLPGLI family protein [Polaribacter sp.]|uniref:GLPGLI family protein n=1 Tax=Flavobacteriaceae TaxID=49546 RepID=UPI00326512B0
MKKILTLTLLIIAGFSNAQEGIVIYTVNNNMDKANEYLSKARDTIKNKYLKKTMDEIYGSSPSINSTLKFVNGESMYQVEQKLKNEIDNNLANKLMKSFAGGDNIYYVNLKEDKNQIQECTLLGECFIINMHSVKWNLTQKQKMIGKYNCFLAKATYKMYSSTISLEAWYTPDIPISLGPLSFVGLPGLIIELKTNKAWFKATKITLNPSKKIVIKKPKVGKEVTSEKFEIILKKNISRIL